jgi:hypothetical protein
MNTAPANVTFQPGTSMTCSNYFNSYDCMAKQLGSVMERNYVPLRLDQHAGRPLRRSTLPVKKVKVEITLDVMNILNFMNKDWGVFRYANFNDVTPVTQTRQQHDGRR